MPAKLPVVMDCHASSRDDIRKDEMVFYSTGLYRADLVVFNTTIGLPG
ncbi:hypothetical protein NML43_10415 [Rhodopseudomonas palustris]|nr:hypothetical protein [Rhodopseudomonas palustris]MCP9627501.1 hypothetical protein [Rhodopseudomonas palustris]